MQSQLSNGIEVHLKDLVAETLESLLGPPGIKLFYDMAPNKHREQSGARRKTNAMMELDRKSSNCSKGA